MFVVVDAEWVKHGKEYTELTQIAAERVDSQWNAQNTLSALVRPSGRWTHDVNHIAYSGYSFGDFMKAERAGQVLNRFRAWLRKDDTLCVRHGDTAALLKKLLMHGEGGSASSVPVGRRRRRDPQKRVRRAGRDRACMPMRRCEETCERTLYSHDGEAKENHHHRRPVGGAGVCRALRGAPDHPVRRGRIGVPAGAAVL